MGFLKQSVLWIGACFILGIFTFQQDPMLGRIKEFDSILMRYTKNIAKATDLDKVIKQFEAIDASVTSENRMKEYYYEVCRGMGKQGDTYILSERDRLNSIMSGASDDEKGVQETEYAYKRRNILESFVDAAAQHVMQELNMDPSEAFNLDSNDLDEEMMQHIHVNDIKFDSKKKGPQTIKLDPKDFKIKTERKKKAKHDEM